MNWHSTHYIRTDHDVENTSGDEVGEPPPENLFIRQMVLNFRTLLLISFRVKEGYWVVGLYGDFVGRTPFDGDLSSDEFDFSVSQTIFFE